MAFQYKLEYVYDETAPSDSSVFIQMRENPPIYQNRIGKEDYDALEEGSQNEFITGLFDIEGVVEVSAKAYRVWVMKSPAYQWQEVLEPVLNFLAETFGESSVSPLVGSANLDGSGFQLNQVLNRRTI